MQWGKHRGQDSWARGVLGKAKGSCQTQLTNKTQEQKRTVAKTPWAEAHEPLKVQLLDGEAES
jgi:hypothetical protein